ncbi:hypothetical protein ACB276_19690 [Enterobacter hormaechei subsp. xiangfangensis]
MDMELAGYKDSVYVLTESEKLIIDKMKEHICCPKRKSSRATEWLSTRDIAEICGLNIYESRYNLLKLLNKNLVICRRDNRRSLFWLLKL